MVGNSCRPHYEYYADDGEPPTVTLTSSDRIAGDVKSNSLTVTATFSERIEKLDVSMVEVNPSILKDIGIRTVTPNLVYAVWRLSAPSSARLFSHVCLHRYKIDVDGTSLPKNTKVPVDIKVTEEVVDMVGQHLVSSGEDWHFTWCVSCPICRPSRDDVKALYTHRFEVSEHYVVYVAAFSVLALHTMFTWNATVLCARLPGQQEIHNRSPGQLGVHARCIEAAHRGTDAQHCGHHSQPDCHSRNHH